MTSCAFESVIIFLTEENGLLSLLPSPSSSWPQSSACVHQFASRCVFSLIFLFPCTLAPCQTFSLSPCAKQGLLGLAFSHRQSVWTTLFWGESVDRSVYMISSLVFSDTASPALISGSDVLYQNHTSSRFLTVQNPLPLRQLIMSPFVNSFTLVICFMFEMFHQTVTYQGWGLCLYYLLLYHQYLPQSLTVICT